MRASRRRRRLNGILLVVIAVLVVLIVVVAVASPHRPAAKAHKTQTAARVAVVKKHEAERQKAARHKAKTRRVAARKSRVASPTPGSGAGLTLITEPDAGIAPIYALLASPRYSLDLEIYELEDDQACAILAADAARGVQVRVLLDAHYVQDENEAAYSYLRAHGVAVRWAPAQFDLTHEKAIVIDDRLAAIMTMNLTAQYYSSTRDFVVVDRNRSDVAAIAATFAGDWASGDSQPASASDLLWSPGAEDDLVALIGSARHELLVENEEMNDWAVIDALEAAAERGVRVEVVMTRESDWEDAFDALVRAGVAVRTYSYWATPYIHAKAIVVDPGYAGERVFVGSQNFSVASLLYDRELGLITARPAIVAGVATVIERDGAGATAWSP
jgi:phosphatidylserine/phosphatidylglycerophosphate/cardiolipin synthase-like enzyme